MEKFRSLAGFYNITNIKEVFAYYRPTAK